MSAREHDVPTPDGRALRVREDGDPAGPAILMHHGTPMAGTLYAAHAADARARGARLIAYDRPGYGGSTPHPGRTVADVAADVLTIADALGLERLVTWGVSGGGPHALACGALLGDRVTACAALASVAPSDADGLDWTAGMGEANLVEFAKAREGRDALEPFLHEEAAQIVDAQPDRIIEAMESLLSPVDRGALRGGLGHYFAECFGVGLGPGVEGWVEDDLAFVAPWGFGIQDVRVPLLIWQGHEDLMVPPAHGEWLAGRADGAEVHLSPEDGHLTLLEHRVTAVHEWLLASAGAAP
jgi:pimeloyl-ACP methyl ester carboxylesterase